MVAFSCFGWSSLNAYYYHAVLNQEFDDLEAALADWVMYMLLGGIQTQHMCFGEGEVGPPFEERACCLVACCHSISVSLTDGILLVV